MGDSNETMPWERKRVVWVLGAGASIPVGGPPLTTLLTRRSYDFLKQHYQERWPKEKPPISAGPYQDAVRLYHFGRGYPEGQIVPREQLLLDRAIKLWEDAEDFLDTLDTAALDEDGALAKLLRAKRRDLWEPSDYRRLSSAPPEAISTLAGSARKLVCGHSS